MTHALVPNMQAPNLDVSLVNGDTWKLSEISPKSFTMVIFYRGLHCFAEIFFYFPWQTIKQYCLLCGIDVFIIVFTFPQVMKSSVSIIYSTLLRVRAMIAELCFAHTMLIFGEIYFVSNDVECGVRERCETAPCAPSKCQ